VSPAPLELSPQVALRPEPFGALAYHYGNRRLTFLRSPELVALVRSLGEHPGTEEALAAAGIDAVRWPAFRTALASLVDSEVLCERREPLGAPRERQGASCSPTS
jgi:putative mycofactocin binding protein MftB